MAVDGVGLFNPREHDVEPFFFSTACLEARDLSTEAEALRARHPPRTNGFPQSEEHEIVRRWFHEHLRFRYGST